MFISPIMVQLRYLPAGGDCQNSRPNPIKHSDALYWSELVFRQSSVIICITLRCFFLSADFKHTTESVSSWRYPHWQPVYAAHNTGGHGHSSAPSRRRRVDPRVSEHTPASHAEILMSAFESTPYWCHSTVLMSSNEIVYFFPQIIFSPL